MEISKGQPSSNEDTVATHRLRLLACFVLPLVLSVLIALLFEPLRLYQAEEYLSLSQQSAAVPSSLFRPPGYVAFLRLITVASGPLSNDRAWPIYIGQGVVLGLATMAWYIMTCRWLTPSAACLMALAFGCNPLMVALVGYIHYDILHLGLSVLAGLLLVGTFANNTISLRWAMLAGIACGVLTLVVPAFLALALGAQVGRAGQSRTWLAWAAFSLAMAAAIVPRTWSNYARTGRFIPVNAETMSGLWPMFEEPIRPNSNNFPWLQLWFNRAIPLLKKQVGAAALDPNYVTSSDPKFTATRPIVLEDVLSARVRELIRTQPGVYFSNLAHNAIFFWAGDSRMRIRKFVFYQDQGIYVHPATWATDFFIISSAFLRICGALGLALGLWRRNPPVTILASLFICFWIVHSMVYLDCRYLYIQLPFMFWFTGYLVSESFKHMASANKWMISVSAAFAMSSLLGTLLLVF